MNRAELNVEEYAKHQAHLRELKISHANDRLDQALRAADEAFTTLATTIGVILRIEELVDANIIDDGSRAYDPRSPLHRVIDDLAGRAAQLAERIEAITSRVDL
jgi:hypothetical protein